MDEYKSTEQRILDNLGHIGNGVYEFGRASYGAVAGMFRFPTSVRKMVNDQTLMETVWRRDERFSTAIGGVLGLLSGIISAGGIITYLLNEAVDKRNYIPIGVLVATNVASGLFELGRLPKSRQENLELKAQ